MGTVLIKYCGKITFFLQGQLKENLPLAIKKQPVFYQIIIQ